MRNVLLAVMLVLPMSFAVFADATVVECQAETEPTDDGIFSRNVYKIVLPVSNDEGVLLAALDSKAKNLEKILGVAEMGQIEISHYVLTANTGEELFSDTFSYDFYITQRADPEREMRLKGFLYNPLTPDVVQVDYARESRQLSHYQSIGNKTEFADCDLR